MPARKPMRRVKLGDCRVAHSFDLEQSRRYYPTIEFCGRVAQVDSVRDFQSESGIIEVRLGNGLCQLHFRGITNICFAVNGLIFGVIDASLVQLCTILGSCPFIRRSHSRLAHPSIFWIKEWAPSAKMAPTHLLPSKGHRRLSDQVWTLQETLQELLA